MRRAAVFSSAPESLPHSSDPGRKEKPQAQITTKVRRLQALPADFPANAASVHFPSLHHDCDMGAEITADMGYLIIHHSTQPYLLSPTACGVIIRASINPVPHFRMSTATACLHKVTSQFAKDDKVPVIKASSTGKAGLLASQEDNGECKYHFKLSLHSFFSTDRCDLCSPAHL